MIGSTLVERYQILEKIGGGGMAIVYKARCTLLNRIVAVKVLRPQYVSDEDFVRRFRREAQAAASLSHPNIVNIYDVGQDKETYFIVMEYVEGETLKDLINREAPLESSKAVNLTKQIANALFHAHNNKIIHRDIKPHNVLISKDGRVKVADFGIARAVTSTTQTFSPNSIMGSVHYFSPEQARGKLATEQSDIYSLGIVLYEMLTNKLPFDGESPISIALKHLQQTIPAVSEYNSNVPVRLQGILAKMLEKERSKRYPNITDILSDLKDWNSDLPLGQQDVAKQDTMVYAPVNQKPGRKKPWAKVATKVGIIGLALGLVVLGSIWGIRAIEDFLRVAEVEVPDVMEDSYEDAARALEAAGLRYEVIDSIHSSVPNNHVVAQRPSGGQVVKQDRIIQLTISKGPEMVDVPNVEGKDEREAVTQLNSLGLGHEVVYEFSDEPFGVVIRQSPRSGNVVRNQVIRLVVSEGEMPTPMINLVDLTLREALEEIERLLLNKRFVNWEQRQGESPGGIVVSHKPEAGSQVRPGNPIDLNVRPFNRISKNITVEGLDPDERDTITIIITDITGSSRELERISEGSETYSEVVSGWERGSIVVYVNGTRYLEQDF